MFRAPDDLSKRAVVILKQMASHEDTEGGELACEGIECWVGDERTSRSIVRQLLECVFMKDVSDTGGIERYVINESGKRFLLGKKPYFNGNGEEYATIFDLLAAESEKQQVQQCRGTIEKEWPGHRCVLWRRQCALKTRHESGYCRHHRHCHTTTRK